MKANEGRETEDRTLSPRPRGTARQLSMLATALAVAAIALAFLVPGPPGAGTRMAQASRGGPLAIGATCTHYAGAEVTIAVPGPGTVVVSATVGVGINHMFGASDEARLDLAITDADCAITNYTAFISVPADLPTAATYYETAPLLRPFRVSAATSLTVYVDGVMAQGADASDRFDSASLVAMYHPD